MLKQTTMGRIAAFSDRIFASRIFLWIIRIVAPALAVENVWRAFVTPGITPSIVFSVLAAAWFLIAVSVWHKR